jgi:hypothetical protein
VLTVCCFKWKPQKPGYRSQFAAEHVRVLRNMVARHYKQPHRFVCITDDAKGLDDIETIPLWSDHANVPSPHGGGNPSCYRRLKLFDPAIEGVLGKRIVSIDLDTVIVNDLSPLWDRPEDFVIWGGETDKRSWYNGSMWMLTAGSRSKVWTTFHPHDSPRAALRAGRFGSDQGWISHVLGKGEATWTQADGCYSWRVHLAPKGGQLPENARVIFFHGKNDPWHYDCMQVDWIREHWQ